MRRNFDRLLLALVARRLRRDRGFAFAAALNKAVQGHVARRADEIGGVERQLAIQQAWNQEREGPRAIQ